MNKKYKDLTGILFGDLVPIEIVGTDKSGCMLWKCKCTCGNTIVKSSKNLKRGNPSCGCKTKDHYSDAHKTHGLSSSRIYNIYRGMKYRCYDPKSKDYANYGKRGIKMCEEWNKNFINFYNWSMKNGYADNLTIDRIDVNGNYDPLNCRWVDIKVQHNNTRANHYVVINGVKKTVSEWAKINNINYDTAISRINKQGWDPIKAVTTPTKDENMYITYKGETHSLKEWSLILGIEKKTLGYRLRKWKDVAKSFETPIIISRKHNS